MSSPTSVEEIVTAESEPLPLTLRFVMCIGASIVVGWFAMFLLLQARW